MACFIDDNLVEALFSSLGLVTPAEYLSQWPFYQNWTEEKPLGLDQWSKLAKDDTASVDKNNKVAFQPEFDDLIRLHWLCLSRNVMTVLEIGSGFSTHTFDHAMNENRTRFAGLVGTAFRKTNLFQVHSLDASAEWIEVTRARGVSEAVVFHQSGVQVSEFNGRICTYFDVFPQVSPDLIYLDGPDQFAVSGEIRGVTTGHPDRMPMAADLLAIEHFLTPGTLIVVDGRQANARFLASNFQRNWAYQQSEIFDQSFFELREPPLGRFNRRALDFQSEGLKLFSP